MDKSNFSSFNYELKWDAISVEQAILKPVSFQDIYAEKKNWAWNQQIFQANWVIY